MLNVHNLKLRRFVVSYAVKENFILKDKAIELGKIISNPALGRSNDQQITVADLTGIAVQDIQIAALIDKAWI